MFTQFEKQFARGSFAATFVAFAALSGCASGTQQIPSVPHSGDAVASLRAASSAQQLYAYSPGGIGLVAQFPLDAHGSVAPANVLAGSKTGFAGGPNDWFGGGISIASSGTLYVFDGAQGKLFAFAPRKSGAVAHGNVRPASVETLPQNGNAGSGVPQYSGFALDAHGDFWTVDRTNGEMVEFPVGGSGNVSAMATLQPAFDTPQGVSQGIAATVADDGQGHVFCSCENAQLFLEMYGITEYDMTGGTPKFVRSFYGIPGSMASQRPAEALHVDPVTQTIYVGLYRPAAVLAYPVDTKTGLAPNPRAIGGQRTTLDTSVASMTTDERGRLYVAIDSRIAVFGPHASGNVPPMHQISNPRLKYSGSDYGNMLATH